MSQNMKCFVACILMYNLRFSIFPHFDTDWSSDAIRSLLNPRKAIISSCPEYKLLTFKPFFKIRQIILNCVKRQIY